MDTYAAKEMDRSDVDKVYRMGGGVIQEAYDCLNELDKAYSVMRVKEFWILDGMEKNTRVYTSFLNRLHC